jgi:hypothetical protein
MRRLARVEPAKVEPAKVEPAKVKSIEILFKARRLTAVGITHEAVSGYHDHPEGVGSQGSRTSQQRSLSRAPDPRPL